MSQMAACFSHETTVALALQFEAELAAACAEHALISTEAAEAIRRACAAFDGAGLEAEAAHAGTLAIPLVARLRAQVPAHAAAVHLGATSQDVADSALMLQAQRALAMIVDEGKALTARLAELAQQHVHTPAMGRTLLQPAEPITVGVRIASWLLGLSDALARLRRESSLAVQLGGPVGTLASLGASGPLVRASLARRLGLVDQLSWHSRRGSLAALGTSLAIVTGAAAKIARDISLLMQPELGELAEPLRPGRGGSSSMPHKRNPTDCQLVLSAALRTPHLAASLLSSLPQELERGLSWQAEAPLLADLFSLTHASLVAMRTTAAGLEIRPSPLPLSPSTLDAASRFVTEALPPH